MNLADIRHSQHDEVDHTGVGVARGQTPNPSTDIAREPMFEEDLTWARPVARANRRTVRISAVLGACIVALGGFALGARMGVTKGKAIAASSNPGRRGGFGFGGNAA